MLSCKHAAMQTLGTKVRKEATATIPKALGLLTADTMASYRMTEEQKTDLNQRLQEAKEMLSEQNLARDSTDTNNVIYRLMALVPFPEQLATPPDDNSSATHDFPMIKAVGRLLHCLPADRGVMANAATMLAQWTTRWTFRFLRARQKALGPLYYFEKLREGESREGGEDEGEDYDDTDNEEELDDEDH
jgi:hypothetical protein